MAYQSVNPYDSKILKTFEEVTDKQLDTALETAANCLKAWRRKTFAERIAVVDRAGAFMQPTILTISSLVIPPLEKNSSGLSRFSSGSRMRTRQWRSPIGLGGSVFTKDVARGKRVASRVNTGMMFVNHRTWTTADLPFGGIKNSGYGGRELSSMSIQEFVNKKLIRVASIDAPA